MKLEALKTLSEELKTQQLSPNTFSMAGEVFKGIWWDLWERYQSLNPSKKFRIWLIDLDLKMYNEN